MLALERHVEPAPDADRPAAATSTARIAKNGLAAPRNEVRARPSRSFGVTRNCGFLGFAHHARQGAEGERRLHQLVEVGDEGPAAAARTASSTSIQPSRPLKDHEGGELVDGDASKIFSPNRRLEQRCDQEHQPGEREQPEGRAVQVAETLGQSPGQPLEQRGSSGSRICAMPWAQRIRWTDEGFPSVSGASPATIGPVGHRG